jgi:hypothetical protein
VGWKEKWATFVATTGCRDEKRVIAGRTENIGTALVAERGHLVPLAAEDFELGRVNTKYIIDV